jgi:hypothetical protein
MSPSRPASPARQTLLDLLPQQGWPAGVGTVLIPAGDIPPTGRRVTVDYIQVLRFHNGKHASFNLMYDRLLLLEQLGLIPAPAATGGP